MSPKTPVNEENSRPASPAIEATEDTTTSMTSVAATESSKESIKLENSRRKSTSWKGKLTRQLSSAQLKLTNPFKDKKGPVMQSEPGTPIEHRELNFPSADCLTVPEPMREALSEGATAVPSEGSSSATLSPNMDANYLTKLEQEITTSLNKLGYNDEATVEDIVDCETDSSDASEDPKTLAQRISPRKRTTSQPSVKRVEFSDDFPVTQQQTSNRPSNLELDEPIRPPRAKEMQAKAMKQRNERLLSVPNLKMNAALKDLRAKSNQGQQSQQLQQRPPTEPSTGFAANFVRRFKWPMAMNTDSYLLTLCKKLPS